MCFAGARTAAAAEPLPTYPQTALPPAAELSDAESGELAPAVAAAETKGTSVASNSALAGDRQEGEEGRKRHRERSRWNIEAGAEANSRRSADGRDARKDERWKKRRRREKHHVRDVSDWDTEHRRRRRSKHRESDDSSAEDAGTSPGRRQEPGANGEHHRRIRGTDQAIVSSVPAAPLPRASESLRAQVRAMLQSVRPEG